MLQFLTVTKCLPTGSDNYNGVQELCVQRGHSPHEPVDGVAQVLRESLQLDGFLSS